MKVRNDRRKVASTPQVWPTTTSDSPMRVALHVTGVDEVAVQVKCPMNNLDGILFVVVGPSAEHHGAEAKQSRRDASSSKRAMLHSLYHC